MNIRNARKITMHVGRDWVKESSAAKLSPTARPMFQLWGQETKDPSGLFLSDDAFHGTATNASPYQDILRFYRSPHHYNDLTYPLDSISPRYDHYHRYVHDSCRVRHTETALEFVRHRMSIVSAPKLTMLNHLAVYYERQIKGLKNLLPIRGLGEDILFTCQSISFIIKNWPRDTIRRWNKSLEPLVLDLIPRMDWTMNDLIDLYTLAPGGYGTDRYRTHLIKLVRLIQEDSKEWQRTELSMKRSRAIGKLELGANNFSFSKASEEYLTSLKEKHEYRSQMSLYGRMAQLVDREEPSLWPSFSIFYMLEPFHGLDLAILRGLKTVTKSIVHTVRTKEHMSFYEYNYRRALWARLRISHAKYAALRAEIRDLTRWYYAIAVFRATFTKQSSVLNVYHSKRSREIVRRRVRDSIVDNSNSVLKVQKEIQNLRFPNQQGFITASEYRDFINRALKLDPLMTEAEREETVKRVPRRALHQTIMKLLQKNETSLDFEETSVVLPVQEATVVTPLVRLVESKVRPPRTKLARVETKESDDETVNKANLIQKYVYETATEVAEQKKATKPSLVRKFASNGPAKKSDLVRKCFIE